MAIIKCRMCGGDLVLTPGSSVAECEYCGTVQTVPSGDDEKKLNLFARADRLREACEFDKSAAVYETIVAEFPREAEAYWGLVLCKYGVEYVDDPGTGMRIPTCHRSSFDGVLEDGDFRQALEHSDVLSRPVYQQEAERLERIRRGIVEASSKEAPYDIFICYKETDAKGDRTLDSVIAQDIYDELTGKGYRVFFARISLEDKLGQAYEPCIFAALNSATVMLAVGTSYDNYNAVWVKNEWSRFLKQIAAGKRKYLIPCYKFIDAYDMPREFHRLQAQDMEKIGAMQDLVRGIGKLLPRGGPAPVREDRGSTGGVQGEQKPGLEAIRKLAQQGQKVQAVRDMRELYGVELKQAKDMVEELLRTGRVTVPGKKASGGSQTQRRSSKPPKPPQPRRDGGGAGQQTRQAPPVSSQIPAAPTCVRPMEPKDYSDQQRRARLLQWRIGTNGGEMLCQDGSLIHWNVDINGKESLSKSPNAPGTMGYYIGDHGSGVLDMGTPFRWNGTWGGHRIFLKWDGRFYYQGDGEKCPDWEDIVDAAGQADTIAGLTGDGRVLVASAAEERSYPYRVMEEKVKGWRNITAICFAGTDLYALRSDGVVLSSAAAPEMEITRWRDIVSISSAELYQLVGVKADGSVVACGVLEWPAFDVSGWKDVVAVKCSNYYTLGVTKTGKVLRTMTYSYSMDNGKKTVRKLPGYQKCRQIPGACLFDDPDQAARQTQEGLEQVCQRWKDGPDAQERIGYMLETQQKLQGLERNLALNQKKLRETTGLFAGKKRKALEATIAQIEEKIRELKK